MTTYPVSANGHKCVGPCYYKNTHVQHPVTGTYGGLTNQHFCPIYPTRDRDDTILYDKCYIPTHDTEEQFVMDPSFENTFTKTYFIRYYYDIYNLNDLIEWLHTHNIEAYRTHERVFNAGINVYGKDLHIIDNRLTTFIDAMLKHDYNMSKIYNSLLKYIIIIDNNITLTNSEHNNTYDNEQKKVIIKFIKNKFLGLNNIYTYMIKIIKYHPQLLTEENVLNNITTHIIDYIIKHIKSST